MSFLDLWHRSAVTSLGLFWTAFWAFGLGYLVSSMIQVFVTRERMRRTMGEAGPRSVLFGTIFGFISSSCSFAALSTTRSLFSKGAGLIPSLAFLLASTNLVVELGIVIAVFLGWQFVVGEYVGGVLLILLTWGLVSATRPEGWIEAARRTARDQEEGGGDGETSDWKALVVSREGWARVADRYLMEWGMVWKDVTIGFTVAGVVAAFVPRAFFQALFPGSDGGDPGLVEVLLQSLVGPLAAFFTFIGSMGNIPLAAVLYENGVSFAGVMAFVFSDLVVLPVLRIQARYYGWRLALYIVAVFLVVLTATALVLHYGLAALDLLPTGESVRAVTDRDFFSIDYGFFLNLLFLATSAGFLVWRRLGAGHGGGGENSGLGERVLSATALMAFVWLALGVLVPSFV